MATRPDRFITLLRNGDNGAFWWDATYLRKLPFTPNTGWTDGDRSGYRCFYCFLLWNGQVVGRVTFARIEGAGYASIGDKYMVEGARHYDGRVATEGRQELGECNQGRESEPYEPSTGPWQLPTITYKAQDGRVLEVRNYKTLKLGVGVTFRQINESDQLVTVVAYEKGIPVIAVYYESMDANVVMASDL